MNLILTLLLSWAWLFTPPTFVPSGAKDLEPSLLCTVPVNLSAFSHLASSSFYFFSASSLSFCFLSTSAFTSTSLAEPSVSAKNQINEKDDYSARVKKIQNTLNEKESAENEVKEKDLIKTKAHESPNGLYRA
jgi:hypothetical protein